MPRYHSRDLRKHRHSEVGNHYLLTAVTQDRTPVFRDFLAARICINALRLQHHQGLVNSLAFVVMPDHFHWLVELCQGELPGLLKAVKGRVARLVNLREGRTGNLWQDGYHEHAIRRDEDLRGAAGYLVANPLRAGLVENLYDYPHWDMEWTVE
jgi:REP element-mobilizing transposase RayT